MNNIITETSKCRSDIAYNRFKQNQNLKKFKMQTYIKETFQRLSYRRDEIEVEYILDTLSHVDSPVSIKKNKSIKCVLTDVYDMVKTGRVTRLFVNQDYYHDTHTYGPITVIDEYVNDIIKTVLRNGGDIIFAHFNFDAKIAVF